MKFKRQAVSTNGINMVPMLDMVFILLLFFTVSANFQHGSRLALSLPSAEGMAPLKQQPVVVAVSQEGRYSVNGSLLGRNDAATLRTVMQGLSKEPAKTPLVISADANATHQSVVTVMDVAGQLGFVNVSISTVKPGSGK